MIEKTQNKGFWDVCNVLLIDVNGGNMSLFTSEKKSTYSCTFFCTNVIHDKNSL